jgi:peptide/nickel transport system substrate-binding protein
METTPQTLALNTYNGLVRMNKDMNGVELDMAESWRQIDTLTYEFKLRKGVRFHDIPPVNGREVTSADVKYSIERISGMYGKRRKFKHQYYFRNKLSAIETPDKYTVIIKTKEPYGSFMSYVGSPFSSIVPKEAVDKFGDLKRNAIGTGPFILKEYQRDSHITLVKNPTYFKKGLPYLDGINYKMISKQSAILAAFLANKLDVFAAEPYQLPTIKKEAPDSKIVEQISGYSWLLRVRPWLDDKPYPPPLNDVRVRQAISMAVDKQRVLSLALEGNGIVQVGAVPNWPPYSMPKSEQVEYNPEKSRKLLAEAGYPNGFTIEFITWNLPYMVKPAQIVQAMLKDVGITTNLKLLEMAQYFNRMFKFDYDFALHVNGAGLDPEEYLAKYFGGPKERVTYSWQNKEVWRLIEEQRKTLDKEKRASMIREIQRLLLKDAANVNLYTPITFSVAKPYVHRTIYKNSYQTYPELYWMEKH